MPPNDKKKRKILVISDKNCNFAEILKKKLQKMNDQEKKEVFGSIFKAQYPNLYYYALQLLKDEEMSRDIVSEVFTRVWENFSFYELDTLPSLLFKMVKNKSLDYLRHSAVHAQYADYYLHAVDECYANNEEDEERIRLAAEMLDLLPDTTRHVLEECYLNHKKYREVAEEMDVCQETVKRHIMKALKMLREHYKKKKT